MRSTICLRCHRALKDPRSIEIGMGKICAGKAKAEKALEKQDELFDFDAEERGQGQHRSGRSRRCGGYLLHHPPGALDAVEVIEGRRVWT